MRRYQISNKDPEYLLPTDYYCDGSQIRSTAVVGIPVGIAAGALRVCTHSRAKPNTAKLKYPPSDLRLITSEGIWLTRRHTSPAP